MSEEPKKNTRRKPAAPSTRTTTETKVVENTAGTAVQLSSMGSDIPEVVTLPKIVEPVNTRRFQINLVTEGEKKLKEWMYKFVADPETVVEMGSGLRHHILLTGDGMTVKVLPNRIHVAISKDGHVGEVLEGAFGQEIADLIMSAVTKREADKIADAKNAQINNILSMIQ